MTLYNISFYQVFYSSLIIIIPRENFLALKWYRSINNTKENLYLHKINKTPLNIYKYINKTCLKRNPKKILSVHHI